MTVSGYIAAQLPERQEILEAIHAAIMQQDKSVIAATGTMMRHEMILYQEQGVFKYGLAGVKNHMSLHLMPIYMNAALHARYEALLPEAEFQKGCINFRTPAQVPLPIIQQLIADCAKVNIADMLAQRNARKKK